MDSEADIASVAAAIGHPGRSGVAVAVTPRGVAGLGGAIGLDVAALAPGAMERAPVRRVA